MLFQTSSDFVLHVSHTHSFSRFVHKLIDGGLFSLGLEDLSSFDDLVPILRLFIIQIVFPASAVNFSNDLILLELKRALLSADFLKHDVYTTFSLLSCRLFVQFGLGRSRHELHIDLFEVRLVSRYVIVHLLLYDVIKASTQIAMEVQ